MSSVPRKRKVLSFEEKFAIINAVSAGEKKKDVAARFNIPASSLSTILSAKDSIREAAESGTGSKKRLKKSTYADVDKAVFTWFLDTRARNVPISGAILQQKAKDFASILGHDDFKASNGWLQGFKSRHGVVGRKILLDIRFERPTKIDIYQAIEMLAASWQEVRAETVVNCFKKARVSVATEAGVDEEEPQEPSNPSDVSEAWDALRVNGGVPDDIALDDFLYADSDAVSTEEMSDVALVETAQDRGDGEGAEADALPLPTAKEVLDALDILRRHVGSQDDEAALDELVSLDRRVTSSLTRKTQAKITQFFCAK
ncbi:hypothetical protein HPB50_025202 [Hyalomma asiaticum]|uniref:Uncharacterized protein n=1 Tax=Hyalomma asiaticum TaxID=266040 RepID=A0ACB7S3M4_HYAAI|nr:hypothetical protein HPB50_025202 [Hyalomma asiaticum]